MRRALVLAVVLLAASACRGDDPVIGLPSPGPSPSPSPSPTASPTELEGSTCQEVQGGSPDAVPEFHEVEVSSEEGMDVVTFRFQPGAGPPVAPSHLVRFVDELITDGEGAPAEVEGEAFVLVIFSAFAVDLSTEEPVEIYTGPDELTPRLGVVREAELLGDFEAQVTWGIGLSRKACYVVEVSADELSVAFPSA
jgi:hypothetical protein